VAGILVVLAIAGCGSGGDEAATGRTALEVHSYDGERLVSTTTLSCAPDDLRCAKVVALLPRLRPVPDEACTLIYGGPERYVIEGTVKGEPVDIEVTRDNGCNIARYDLLTEALGG
jgi:hypothetical protein